MSEFLPFQFHPKGSATDPTVMPSGAQTPPAAGFGIVLPVSRVCDLAQIAGPITPVPGTVYEHDYFLFHPFEGVIQRIWFAASDPQDQTAFAMRVVSKDADGKITFLSDESVFTELPVVGTIVTEQVGQLTQDPLFLRVATTAQDVLLYVTVELLTIEVL